MMGRILRTIAGALGSVGHAMVPPSGPYDVGFALPGRTTRIPVTRRIASPSRCPHGRWPLSTS